MNSPSDLGQLGTSEWQRLQDCADRFEKAWQNGATVDLNQFLPAPGDPLRRMTLLELIKADLEFRWRHGQVLGLEYYVEKFPELGTIRDLPAELIYEEYRVRHHLGDKPPLQAYQTRFPVQFPELMRLLQGQPVKDTRTLPMQATAAMPPSGGPGPSYAPAIGMGYKLLKNIGSGGFGDVWRAEAPGGIEVAVKILSRPLDHQDAKRELKALELIKRLHHPFLLQTHSFFPQQDRLCIVMELAEGSLRGRLKECRQAGLPGIPVAELVGYMGQAAAALDYLHSQKVLHRDIKPDNILLVNQQYAKVADFGLARLREGRLASVTAAGTPAYMAPEMWGGKVSEHTDQYCLAVTYVELRLGRPLFPGKNPLELMSQHLTQIPPLDPLPRAEQDVLRRALAKSPDQRYPSCKAFAQALEQAGQLCPAPRTPVQGPSGPATASPPPIPAAVGGADGNSATLEVVTPPGAPAPAPPPAAADYPDAAYGTMGVVTPASAAALKTPGSELLPTDEDWAPLPEPETVPLPARVPATRRLLWWTVGIATGVVLAVLAVVFWPSPEPPPPILPQDQWVTLPKGYRIVEGKPSLDWKGKKVCTEIEYEVSKDLRIPFVFIPGKPEEDLRPFYIMKNKVSNELFAAFLTSKSQPCRDLLAMKAANKAEVRYGNWSPRTDKGQGQLPVLQVTVIQAYYFARWLEGKLPTVHQWDKAAGRYESSRGEGPFRGPLNNIDFNKGEIAVRRSGPMAVGKASKDISLLGCHDMSGNGFEWTRTSHMSEEKVPLVNPEEGARVQSRGMTFKNPKPLTWERLSKRPALSAPYFFPAEEKDREFIGFRVVLELE
jgi:serine/threonine protein kinase